MMTREEAMNYIVEARKLHDLEHIEEPLRSQIKAMRSLMEKTRQISAAYHASLDKNQD